MPSLELSPAYFLWLLIHHTYEGHSFLKVCCMLSRKLVKSFLLLPARWHWTSIAQILDSHTFSKELIILVPQRKPHFSISQFQCEAKVSIRLLSRCQLFHFMALLIQLHLPFVPFDICFYVFFSFSSLPLLLPGMCFSLWVLSFLGFSCQCSSSRYSDVF